MTLKEFLEKNRVKNEIAFDEKPQSVTSTKRWQVVVAFQELNESVVLLINVVRGKYRIWPDTFSKVVEERIEGILFDYGLTFDAPKIAPENSEFEKYEAFFIDYCRQAKRDHFDGLLKVKDFTGFWQPLQNRIDEIKSFATDQGLSAGKIGSHFARYQSQQRRELLCREVPWDGHDHVGEILSFAECSNLEHKFMVELFKEWLALSYERVFKGTQNRMIILQGRQGVGKDHFISEICSGFEPYFSHFTETSQEKDMFMQLSRNIIINISEFDKLNRKDPGFIKDLITRDHAEFRPSHQPHFQKYKMTSSFIGSVNVVDFLTDHTGNRRFVVFEGFDISWTYPKGRGVQVLAQAKMLAQEGFRASGEANRAMAEYLERVTPDDPDDIIIGIWNEGIDEICKYKMISPDDAELRYSDVEKIVFSLQKNFGFRSTNRVFRQIKRLGGSTRTDGKNLYFKIKRHSASIA
jgi:hypothetical protein